MSKFSGPQEAGAARRHRKRLRAEAQERNEGAAVENRRWFRQIAGVTDEVKVAILASRAGVAKTARQFRVSPVVVQAIWDEGRLS